MCSQDSSAHLYTRFLHYLTARSMHLTVPEHYHILTAQYNPVLQVLYTVQAVYRNI